MDRKHPLKEYEIWIGWYHLGQGYDPPSEPQMVGREWAPNFKVACVLHELKSSLNSIQNQIANDEYVDHQSCRWFYDFDKNQNEWSGKYYSSYEEANKSFKK